MKTKQFSAVIGKVRSSFFEKLSEALFVVGSYTCKQQAIPALLVAA